LHFTAKSLTFFFLMLVFAVPLALGQNGAADAELEASLPIGEAAEEAAPLQDVPLISTMDFVRMLVILGVVVGVIYLLFFLLKKGVQRRLPDNETIRVVGSRTLTGTRALHLVEVGRSLYLIGVAEQAVSLISEISDQESIDRVRLESSRPSGSAGRAGRAGFSGLLAGLIRPGKSRGVDLGGTIEYMQKQQERLKKL
jgi:flagellar biogenesis protein FliO